MSLLNRVAALFRGEPGAAARGEPGRRAYVVGDIHGRSDLLDQLLRQIDEDHAAAGDGRERLLVFLGDYVDRGSDSAGVLDRLSALAAGEDSAVFLCGNHEEALIRVLDGQSGVLRSWLSFGGSECASSYGIDEDELRIAGHRQAAEILTRRMPNAHLRFLNRLEETHRFGDYLFVHAGIRPGVRLDRQKIQDLRWIREPFLNDARQHGFVVVHGHTIVEAVEERPNRIGIDTGAYRSGILTALVIEDDRRRYLSTTPDD